MTLDRFLGVFSTSRLFGAGTLKARGKIQKRILRKNSAQETFGAGTPNPRGKSPNDFGKMATYKHTLRTLKTAM